MLREGTGHHVFAHVDQTSISRGCPPSGCQGLKQVNICCVIGCERGMTMLSYITAPIMGTDAGPCPLC